MNDWQSVSSGIELLLHVVPDLLTRSLIRQLSLRLLLLIFFSFLFPQFTEEASAACGARLTNEIPNPPAIIAPIIANIFLILIVLSFNS
jgi:hypothetical protein